MPAWTIVGGAVAGGLTSGLAVGAAQMALRGKGKKKAKLRQQVLPICVIVPMVITFPVAEPVGNVLEDTFNPPQTRVEAMTRYFGRKMLKDPVLKARFAGMDQAQANATAQELAREGAAYLDDDRLQRRTELVVELLRNGGPGVAVGLYTGKMDPAALQYVLEQLQPKDRRDWFQLSFDAMKARLQGGTKVTYSDQQKVEALQAMAAVLGENDGPRVMQILASSRPTPSEASYACNMLYEHLYKLDPEHRRVLNRVLAAP